MSSRITQSVVKVIAFAFSLLIVIMVSPAASGQVLSAADVNLKDVDVYEYSYRNWNNANTGAWGGMSIGTNINGMAGTRRRAFFWFDVDAVRAIAGNPTEVKLQLSYSMPEGNAASVNVFRVMEPWKEGDGMYHSGQVEPNAPPGVICWSRQPGYDRSNPVARYTFSRPAGAGGVAAIDITKLYQAWISGRYTNYGLVLVAADEQRDRFKIDIQTSETSWSDQRPRLIVAGGSVVPGTGDQLTITYCDGSTQVIRLDQPASKVASIGFPCTGGLHVDPPGPGGGGGTTNLAPQVWQPHRTNEGVTHTSGDQLCVQAKRPGGAWFTTRRPYDFSRDYTVELDFMLHDTDNHYIIIYSDGFVSINIDWGVDLGHVQPGASWNLVNGLANLEIGKWYTFRVDAQPWQGTFDLYLNGRKLSTAQGLPSPPADYHTASSQITDSGVIFFGDPDDISYQGGSYNRGSGCWRNLKVSVR
jgi:hypothetical protein